MNHGTFEFGEGGSTRGGNDAGARWNVLLMGGNTSAVRGGLICW
jgi:hypothetical protein